MLKQPNRVTLTPPFGGNDHEVEFHEIETGGQMIMRSNYFASFHEIEILSFSKLQN
jgi:hypothetical protein